MKKRVGLLLTTIAITLALAAQPALAWGGKTASIATIRAAIMQVKADGVVTRAEALWLMSVMRGR